MKKPKLQPRAPGARREKTFFLLTFPAVVVAVLLLRPFDFADQRAIPAPAASADRFFPLVEGSARFAVIGDGGTGKAPQCEVGEAMEQIRKAFPFEFVLMVGDNIYGRESRDDFVRKFERPYRALLKAGVRFHAVLGNHDDTKQRQYEPFGMEGRYYYSFARRDVRFFALDSCRFDATQRQWLDSELAASREKWKICFFHHPLYSSGHRHGPDVKLRDVLEPILVRHGVDLCLSGHEHFYERLRPRKGIHYFISGAAGQLRKNGARRTDDVALAFDTDRHFMIFEVAGDTLYFQAVSRTGEVVDSGKIVM